MEGHLGGGDDFRETGGGLAIGEQFVDFGDIAQSDHGVTAELGVVGGQENLAGVVDDGPGGTNLAIVEVQEGPIQVNPADADNAVVHLELADEIDGRLADDPLVAVADQASGHDDLKVIVRTHNRGHVEVVGDYPQPFVVAQRTGDGFRRCADIDE
ncbi:hypothetical protein DESC_720279 [Desulfosarcina cetonica]|nr:hypothetical protein DESC_720279 [Desulfosarcina cetonica]